MPFAGREKTPRNQASGFSDGTASTPAQSYVVVTPVQTPVEPIITWEQARTQAGLINYATVTQLPETVSKEMFFARLQALLSSGALKGVLAATDMSTSSGTRIMIQLDSNYEPTAMIAWLKANSLYR
jgi:hypothetical protein